MNFRPRRKLRVRAKLDLVPLVTVFFLLLMFFILSSTFAVHAPLNFEYAKGAGPVSFEQKDLAVTLVHNAAGPGRIFVNDVPVESLDELTRVLDEARRDRPDLLLLIRPDARIPSSRLIEVVGIAQNVGIARYRIAAQPSGAPDAGAP